MGKKKEARLLATIDQLYADQRKVRDEKIQARRRDMTNALREMSEQKFIIVTKTGRVVTGRVATTNVSSTPIDVSSSGSAWRILTPGPIEYRAQIIVEPFE